MPTPRGTKLRSFPVTKPAPLPSRSRPRNPPAKVLSSRKAAALGRGGGRPPPRIRKELDREPTPRRVREPREETPVRTRAGKRAPKAARHDEAAEQRDAQPSRRAGNRQPDVGARRLRKAREASRRH